MAFLQSLAKEDLGVFVAGQDFIGTQSMRERFSQNITLRSAFGFSHPVIRSKSPADSNAVSFSFILLKSGVQRGLNSYEVLRNMEDFEIQTKKGSLYTTYPDSNWTDIDVDSSMDAVTVSVDCMVPGFIP